MQALLLAALEEFSEPDIATILNVPQASLRELFAQGRQALWSEHAERVLPLCGEPIEAMDLEMQLEDLNYSVVGLPRNFAHARELLRTQNPDAIILTSAVRFGDDLAPLSSVAPLLELSGAAFVLTTGYPQRFLTDATIEPVFVVDKPHRPNAVAAVLCQALRFRQARSTRRIA